MLEKTRVPAVIGGQAPLNTRSPAIRFSFSHFYKTTLRYIITCKLALHSGYSDKNTVLKLYCMHVQDLLIFYDGY